MLFFYLLTVFRFFPDTLYFISRNKTKNSNFFESYYENKFRVGLIAIKLPFYS